jgi:hypothetical protein
VTEANRYCSQTINNDNNCASKFWASKLELELRAEFKFLSREKPLSFSATCRQDLRYGTVTRFPAWPRTTPIFNDFIISLRDSWKGPSSDIDICQPANLNI